MKGVYFSCALAVATLFTSIFAADVDPIVIKVSAETYIKSETQDIDGFFRGRSFSTRQTGRNCKQQETDDRNGTDRLACAASFEALHINVRCPPFGGEALLTLNLRRGFFK